MTAILDELTQEAAGYLPQSPLAHLPLRWYNTGKYRKEGQT